MFFADVTLTGELLKGDNKPGTAGTDQPTVSFAEGTTFEREKTGTSFMEKF